MREIITKLNDLGYRCDEINIRKQNEEMRTIILALKEVIREKGLTALSAPEIGFDKRIFVVKFGNELRSFINPVILSAKGLQISQEVSPCFPGKKYIRPRNTSIVLGYETPLGKPTSQQIVGLSAIVIQHEVDCLDGIYLPDIGMEIDENFENASEEERAEVIKMYLESLDVKEKELRKEIEDDEELSKIDKAIEFMESVQKGETKVECKKIPTVRKRKDEDTV